MSTENIERFLANSPDSYLVVLLEEIDGGRLSFASCGCFVGLRTADHGPVESGEYCDDHMRHLEAARRLPYAHMAEYEFNRMGEAGDDATASSDELRRERLRPLVLAEMSRRGPSTAQSTASIFDAHQELAVG